MQIESHHAHDRSKSDLDEEQLVTLDDYRVMVFTSCGEFYAVPLMRVKEVIGRAEITGLSFTPSYLKGVTNLRGQVITVVDFQEKLRHVQDEEATSIIILDMNDVSVGIIVNEVDFVCDLSEIPIALPPEVEGMTGKEQFLLGIARRKGDLIKLVDIDRFIDLDSIKIVVRGLGSTQTSSP